MLYVSNTNKICFNCSYISATQTSGPQERSRDSSDTDASENWYQGVTYRVPHTSPAYHEEQCVQSKSLRKHTYSNILKILPPKKNENFQIKILIFFLFLLKT